MLRFVTVNRPVFAFRHDGHGDSIGIARAHGNGRRKKSDGKGRGTGSFGVKRRPEKVHDILIAGAGPAGSTAAREAGKKGLSVLLIDKEAFPRPKPCGGGLSEKALGYLDEPLPEGLKKKEVSGIRFRFGNCCLEGRAGTRIATMISRAAFDHFLVRRAVDAGIALHENERALRYEERPDGIRLFTSRGVRDGKYLIIAEGSQGPLTRQVRERDGGGRYGVSLVSEIPVERDRSPEGHSKTFPEIYFDALYGGYGWVFPQGDTFSVGIGTFTRHPARARSIFRSFLSRCGFPPDAPARGHVIPAGGFRRTIRRSRVLLAGDAAGFVDPFSGEGIAYALQSGRLAGQAVADAVLTGDEEGPLVRYEKRCRLEFDRPFFYSRMTAKLFYAFPGPFFRAFAAHEELFRRFFLIPQYPAPYRDFLLWLLPRVPRYLLRRRGQPS